MAEPLVSVIVPCYNSEKFLPFVFNCLNRQTYRNFQAIFINDGSCDTTLKLLQNYCAFFPQHTLITSANEGVASARNKGIKSIKGELFTFFDPDDLITDNHLELLVKNIMDGRADMAVCAIKRISEKKEKKFNLKNKPRAVKFFTFDKERALEQYFSQKIFDFPLCNKIYRTSILRKSGARFLDGSRYGEEAYFIYKYLSYSDKTVYYNAKTYIYLQRKTSLMHTAFNENRLDLYTNLNAVINEVIKSGRALRLLPYIKVMRAGYSVGILYFILHSEYNNACVITSIKHCLKMDVKHIKYCKKIALYKKLFLPVCAFIAGVVFSRLKEQNGLLNKR